MKKNPAKHESKTVKQISEVGVAFQQGSMGHREFTCTVHLSESSVPRPFNLAAPHPPGHKDT